MRISELITPARVACSGEAGSKKRVLERLGELAVADVPDLTSAEVFDSLIERERLGGTGLGHGVALPHGRMKGGRRAIGALMTLKEGIDFDAPDRQPVDLLFALLVPEHYTDEHLQILAQLAKLFSDAQMCATLRGCGTGAELLAAVADWEQRQAAA